MKKAEKISIYWEQLRKKKIEPNFWISVPYLLSMDVDLQRMGKVVWLTDKKGCLFPPIHSDQAEEFSEIELPKEIWADFHGQENYLKVLGYHKNTFLDYEYIYDPKNFMDLSGKKWKVFRKNIRRWPQGRNWRYSEELSENYHSGASNLLLDWFAQKDNQIYDADIIVSWILYPTVGVHRKILWEEDRVVAVNLWDENYQYLNYRWCISQPKIPYLDEFVRWLFYKDISVQNKLVNDGGVLDNAGLERFKDKLNPIRKREVWSWKKI
jgi:hypothetical protein